MNDRDLYRLNINKFKQLGDYLCLFQRGKHQSQKETSAELIKNCPHPIWHHVPSVAKLYNPTTHAPVVAPTKAGPLSRLKNRYIQSSDNRCHKSQIILQVIECQHIPLMQKQCFTESILR